MGPSLSGYPSKYVYNQTGSCLTQQTHTSTHVLYDDNGGLHLGDYILVTKRFRSAINIYRNRSFPRADIGSDHDLVMMTFRGKNVKVAKTKG